jgi:hypothetical protein
MCYLKGVQCLKEEIYFKDSGIAKPSHQLFRFTISILKKKNRFSLQIGCIMHPPGAVAE